MELVHKWSELLKVFVGAGAGTLFFMIKHLNLIGFGKREINSVATIMHT
jgi:hypothetical protein